MAKEMDRHILAATMLTEAVRDIAFSHRAAINSLKKKYRKAWHNPHFVWNALLLSFSTMGNSRGAILMEDPSIRSTVEFDVLRRLSPPKRRTAISCALRAAKVRMPDIKTRWLMDNYDRIIADGGPGAVKTMIESSPGRDTKILFMKSFRGIGDKYARNILMDVYHPEFRQSIAYDERLKKVSEALGLDFGGKYQAAENFFLGVAESAGLSGWELDRLLYRYTNEVISALGQAACASARRRAASTTAHETRFD